MKIYIAGKITGDPNYREKFQKAKNALEAKGYTVLTPSVLPGGMTPADYMRICFAMIDSADAVFFLHDWASSKGARLERQYCQYIGKSYYQEGGGGLYVGKTIYQEGGGGIV